MLIDRHVTCDPSVPHEEQEKCDNYILQLRRYTTRNRYQSPNLTLVTQRRPEKMDLLPKEILKLILNYFDDKTRRLARLSCKEWFNIIDYRDFTLYLTKKSVWPQIADRLSSYSKPISLNFRKIVMKNLHDINEHLLCLTNLTDLNFDELDSEEDNLTNEWLKLTALPNLHSVNVDHFDYTIPMEALLSLPNRTKFREFWQDEGNNSEELKAFRRWTNLQNCWITPNDNVEMDLFDSYNTKLTSLFLRMNKAPGKWFNQLGDLKDLSLELKIEDLFSLKSLTAVECLVLNGIQIHEVNSTNLTLLEMFSVEEKYIEQEADKLASLKELIFDFEEVDYDGEENDNTNGQRYSNQWLTALTALEYLNVDPIETSGLAFVSTSLTRLQFRMKRPVDFKHLSRLVSLKELYFRSDNETLQDLSLLSMLTQLDTLQITLSNTTNDNIFVSSMTNLTWLSLSGCSCSNISHLPNLLSLSITYTTGTHYGGFEGLPKLTDLEVANHGDDDIDLDYSFVSNITTLQYLKFYPENSYECKYFSTLTNLDYLHFYEVSSEDDYCHLSTLTKLTYLVVRSSPPSAKIFNLPTSLQHLEVDFTSFINSLATKSEDDSDNEEDFTTIIEPLLARLSNLYKHRFK